MVPFFERYSVGNLANLKKSLVKKAGEERAEYDCKVQEIYHGLDALLEGSWQSFDQYVGTVEKLEAVDATLAEREAEMRKEK